jgi:predicted AAA+ superfamily ATPase
LKTWIWNKVRHAVDDNEGCYILTGSSYPAADETRHSGAGRVIRFKLRPMSWYELGYSSGEISLNNILSDQIKTTKMKNIEIKDRLSILSEVVDHFYWMNLTILREEPWKNM